MTRPTKPKGVATAKLLDIDPSTVRRQEHVRRRSRLEVGPRRMLLLAAVVIAVAAMGWFVLDLANMTEQPASVREDLILAGETMLQADPLIVAAAPGPEPKFDTSELGTEILWEPVLAIDDETERQIAQFINSYLSERVSLKMTIVGRLLGEPWFIDVSDGPKPPGFGANTPAGNTRMRLIGSPSGGSGSVDFVPVDSRVFIDPPEDGVGEYQYPSTSGWVEAAALPVETAVVSLVISERRRFADSNQKLWMRPRSGAAFFPVDPVPGDVFTITAYAADGTTLASDSHG